MNLRPFHILLIILNVLLLNDNVLKAASTPAVTINKRPECYYVPFAMTTYGWKFSVGDVDITVTHLGLYDVAPFGFSKSHQIGIWDESDSSPLVSATILATSGNADNFVFVEVSPVVLAKNTTYIIGASMPAPQSDWVASNPLSKTISPYINYFGSEISIDYFTKPDLFSPQYDYFGPNFKFAPAPEPCTLLLLTFSGLALRRKR